MKIAVINNHAGLVHGQMPSTIKDAKGRGTLAQAITFVPGINFVEESTIKTLLENPAFAKNFKEYTVPKHKNAQYNTERTGQPILAFLDVEIDGGKEGKKKVPLAVEDAENPLVKLKGDVVKLLIEETQVIGDLQSWQEKCTDSGVKQLLAARIKELHVDPEGGPAAAGR